MSDMEGGAQQSAVEGGEKPVLGKEGVAEMAERGVVKEGGVVAGVLPKEEAEQLMVKGGKEGEEVEINKTVGTEAAMYAAVEGDRVVRNAGPLVVPGEDMAAQVVQVGEKVGMGKAKTACLIRHREMEEGWKDSWRVNIV